MGYSYSSIHKGNYKLIYINKKENRKSSKLKLIFNGNMLQLFKEGIQHGSNFKMHVTVARAQAFSPTRPLLVHFTRPLHSSCIRSAVPHSRLLHIWYFYRIHTF